MPQRFKTGSLYYEFDTNISDLQTNFGDLNADLVDLEMIVIGHSGRITSLESWRTSRHSSITNQTNVSTGTSISTGVITLGLQAPLASSINTEFDSVKTKINEVVSTVNAILTALRSREIIAT